MSFSTVSTTNQKGQIVIPKKLRSELGINSEVKLLITKIDEGVFIQPIRGFVASLHDSNLSYSQLLQKTQGAWKDDQDWIKQKNARSKIEKSASARRKKEW